jgi:hypothetical protein
MAEGQTLVEGAADRVQSAAEAYGGFAIDRGDAEAIAKAVTVYVLDCMAAALDIGASVATTEGGRGVLLTYVDRFNAVRDSLAKRL